MKKIIIIFALMSITLNGFAQEEDYPAPENNLETQEGRAPDSESLNPEEAPAEQVEQEYREPAEAVDNQEPPAEY